MPTISASRTISICCCRPISLYSSVMVWAWRGLTAEPASSASEASVSRRARLLRWLAMPASIASMFCRLRSMRSAKAARSSSSVWNEEIIASSVWRTSSSCLRMRSSSACSRSQAARSSGVMACSRVAVVRPLSALISVRAWSTASGGRLSENWTLPSLSTQR